MIVYNGLVRADLVRLDFAARLGPITKKVDLPPVVNHMVLFGCEGCFVLQKVLNIGAGKQVLKLPL